MKDVEADVEILIDFDELAKVLGHRALHNKSGRAGVLAGLIKVSAKQKGK